MAPLLHTVSQESVAAWKFCFPERLGGFLPPRMFPPSLGPRWRIQFHPLSPKPDDYGDEERHHSEPQINGFQACEGKPSSHQGPTTP